MYPVLFRIGDFEITSFGVLVAVAALVACGSSSASVRPGRFVLGTYLAATGSTRFAIEFLRMRESLFGPFAVAHVFSLAAIGVGVALLYRGIVGQ